MSPLWLSLQTAFVATFLTMIVGVLCARWRMKREGALSHLLDTLFMLPIALPPSVVGLLLLLIFGRSSPIGQMLAHLGWSIIFTWSATVLASFVVSFPIMYQTARGAFQQIDPSLLDAAKLFGRSDWRTFRRIILPLAWPGLAAGTILSFLRALGEFGATLMIAGNIPGRTQTAPVAIFFAVDAGEQREAIALAFALLLLSLGAIIILNRLTHYHSPPP
ncbi:MAG: molybdenum transporter, permease protein [Chthoniobacteraceae bacterium]|nr:molybdenum transporter, permease protein [Chthoniobacteraceae bacterium]